jgi:hypothetical protein
MRSIVSATRSEDRTTTRRGCVYAGRCRLYWARSATKSRHPGAKPRPGTAYAATSRSKSFSRWV